VSCPQGMHGVGLSLAIPAAAELWLPVVSFLVHCAGVPWSKSHCVCLPTFDVMIMGLLLSD